MCDCQAPAEYDEFLRSGMVNGRQHGWVFLSIPPGVAYPLHAHPGLEMVYIVSGRLHEIRLQEPMTYSAVVGEPGLCALLLSYSLKALWLLHSACHQTWPLTVQHSTQAQT